MPSQITLNELVDEILKRPSRMLMGMTLCFTAGGLPLPEQSQFYPEEEYSKGRIIPYSQVTFTYHQKGNIFTTDGVKIRFSPLGIYNPRTEEINRLVLEGAKPAEVHFHVTPEPGSDDGIKLIGILYLDKLLQDGFKPLFGALHDKLLPEGTFGKYKRGNLEKEPVKLSPEYLRFIKEQDGFNIDGSKELLECYFR